MTEQSKSLRIAEIYLKHHKVFIEDKSFGTTFCIREVDNQGVIDSEEFNNWSCLSDCTAYDLCCELLGNRDGPVLSAEDVTELIKTNPEYFV